METATVALEIRAATAEDGRHYLDGLCVPYGAVSLATEHPYGETFAPGAFAELVASPDAWPRIRLVDSHADTRERRPVAKGVHFAESRDGLTARFRFFDTPEGRGAFENVEEGTYGGLSIGFVPTREGIGVGGAREVRAARLHHVALVDEPAYEQARVLATRAAVNADAVIARYWEERRLRISAPRLTGSR